MQSTQQSDSDSDSDAPTLSAGDIKSDKPPISEAAKKEKRLAVVETFGPTFQGEGPLAGGKTMFIRFGGCDYRCTKCDSLHAVIPSAVKANAQYLTAEEIADRIIPTAKATGTPWVTLSGGNPCMWDLSELIALLHGAELGVALETQGTLAPSWITSCEMVVISPKSPGMGEKWEPEKLRRFLAPFQERFALGKPVPVAFKVVVFSMQDIEFGLEVLDWVARECPNVIHPGMLFLSLGNDSPPTLDDAGGLVMPIDNDTHVKNLLASYRALMDDMLSDPRCIHFRFLPQLHVLAYGNEAGK